MRRRQLYALEQMEMEQRAEIDRQKKIQAEINARNVLHAQQQAGIMWPDEHGYMKSPHLFSPLGAGSLPEPVVTPSDEIMETTPMVEAQAAPIKRRGRPPKVR